MAKAYFEYVSDTGKTYAFLQDTATAGDLGNISASVGTSRLPDKLKPRRLSVRFGASPFTYRHPVFGAQNFGTVAFGDSHLGGIVVGFDDEVNNAEAAY